MRFGVRLGIDVGKARIGVAKSDPHGMLATPVETVTRDAKGAADIQRIMHLAEEHNAFEMIVGFPLSMQGEHTPSTQDAIDFAERLAHVFPQVRLVDERLSTVTAWNQLHQSGSNHKKGRSLVDQVAAVVILQQALDTEQRTGAAPGQLVNLHQGEQ